MKENKEPKKNSKKSRAAKTDKYASFLSGNSKFFNRELSWLEFDDRILHEARDTKNPLLERLRFLSITASNLDEFYIVRVASLRDMQSINFEEKDIAGFTTSEQLERIDLKTRQSMALMYSTYNRSLIPLLKSEGIRIQRYEQLDSKERKLCDEYFSNVLYPILTPMAVDASRPFPLIYNRMLNIAVMIEPDGNQLTHHGRNDGENNSEYLYATLQVPTVVPRMFRIAKGKTDIFVPIEDIIQNNLSLLFNDQKVLASGCYRVMRNADLDIDEDEAEDLLKEIEEQVRKRRFGEIIRLEVQDDIDPDLLEFITTELKISEKDIFSVNGPIDLTRVRRG